MRIFDDLTPTACSSCDNQKGIRINSPDTRSNKIGLEASNVKNIDDNLTTAEKPTNFLRLYMYIAMCFNKLIDNSDMSEGAMVKVAIYSPREEFSVIK